MKFRRFCCYIVLGSVAWLASWCLEGSDLELLVSQTPFIIGSQGAGFGHGIGKFPYFHTKLLSNDRREMVIFYTDANKMCENFQLHSKQWKGLFHIKKSSPASSTLYFGKPPWYPPGVIPPYVIGWKTMRPRPFRSPGDTEDHGKDDHPYEIIPK